MLLRRGLTTAASVGVGMYAALQQRAPDRCEVAPSPPALPALFNLSGRVALVTGSSKGLGLEMAQVFAEAGCDVIISSRNQQELDVARAQILSTGVRCTAIVADLSKRDEAVKLARSAEQAYGRVDILVNNAGGSAPTPADSVDDASWDRVMELNVSAAMVLTRELSPRMCERGWGRVINISSIMGHVSKQHRSAYSASKAAMLGLTRAGAIDLGPRGVTVNTLCPGYFMTELPRSLMTSAQLEAVATRAALGRVADPRELAGAALLLASDAGSFITGSALVVDGGYLIKGV